MISNILKLYFILVIHDINVYSYHHHHHHHHVKQKFINVFSWKQIEYDFEDIQYLNSTDLKYNSASTGEPVPDSEKFFIQYNNVPIGFEVSGDRIFVTVPRRRHGIPSTLNYVHLSESSTSPLLKPYLDRTWSDELVSVYRPRIDACGRLWAVDTGLLEVPGERKQLKPPRIFIFDLTNDKELLRYELKPTDLIDERTPAGLTSITVDVNPASCEDAYAYINDLATEGLVVFSLRERDSWRIDHSSFKHDDSAMNFNVAGHVLNWKDGLFSVALSDTVGGKRTAYYHALVSTKEYSIDTQVLKNRSAILEGNYKLVGDRGPNTQSGSHDYHSSSGVMFFANVAQDAVLCWRVDSPLSPDNMAVAARDNNKLVYISDLKVVKDEVWVLVNQIPRFVYSTLDPNEFNYYIHRAKIEDLIRGTTCSR